MVRGMGRDGPVPVSKVFVSEMNRDGMVPTANIRLRCGTGRPRKNEEIKPSHFHGVSFVVSSWLPTPRPTRMKSRAREPRSPRRLVRHGRKLVQHAKQQRGVGGAIVRREAAMRSCGRDAQGSQQSVGGVVDAVVRRKVA